MPRTHLEDAVVGALGEHDGGVSRKGAQAQRQLHLLLVVVLHQVVLDVATAAECQRMAV